MTMPSDYDPTCYSFDDGVIACYGCLVLGALVALGSLAGGAVYILLNVYLA